MHLIVIHRNNPNRYHFGVKRWRRGTGGEVCVGREQFVPMQSHPIQITVNVLFAQVNSEIYNKPNVVKMCSKCGLCICLSEVSLETSVQISP